MLKPISATDRGQGPRNPWVEGLRFVAAFGIVAFHMQVPGQAVFYAALALFATLTAYLALRSMAQSADSSAVMMRNRIARLLVPWIAWSAFFLALAWLRGWKIVGLQDNLRAILIGPEIHLWFLPFLIVVLPLTWVAARLVVARPGLWAGAVCASIAVSVAAFWAHDHASLPAPFAQWCFATPPYLLGLVWAGMAFHGVSFRAQLGGVALWLAVVSIGAGLVQGIDSLGQLLLGAAMLAAVFALPVPQSVQVQATMSRLGELAFGIYLCHPFFTLVLFRGMPEADGTIWGAVVVFVVSAVTIAISRRVPVLRTTI